MIETTSVIIGMGPGGLESAINLLDLGHSVHVIDTRTNPFMRDQRIVLDEEYLNYLYYKVSAFGRTDSSDLDLSISYDEDDPIFEFRIVGLSEKTATLFPVDHDFFTSVIQAKGIATIKSLQNYLHLKLLDRLKQSQTILHEASCSAIFDKIWNLYNLPAGHSFLTQLFQILAQDFDIPSPDTTPDASAYPINSRTGWELFDKLYEFDKDLQLASVEKYTLFSSQVSSFYQEVVLWSKNALETYMGCTLNNIDFKKGVAQVERVASEDHEKNEQEKTLRFDTIVFADGANRSALKKIPGIPVVTKSLPTPRPEQKSHGIIRLKLKDTCKLSLPSNRTVISPTVENSSLLSHQHLSLLKPAGWQVGYLPILYIQYLAQDRQFYVTGEVPNHLLNVSDSKHVQHTLHQYAATILAIEFPELKTTDFEQSSPSLDSSVFSLQPTHVQLDLDRQATQTHVFIVGDSLLQANYLFGLGIISASKDAHSVSLCFQDNGTFASYSAYDQNVTARLKEYAETNQEYKQMLYAREHPYICLMYEKMKLGYNKLKSLRAPQAKLKP